MTANQVLEIFKKITTIPRGSGNEGPMTDYLCSWAEGHGLEFKRDATGNVCIIREAAPGKEKVPTIVLQAHQDMVCEKLAGFQFNFEKEPIPYVIKDGWMVAENTTLGADDGIGIAACLALLESKDPTGRIEAVFTISEETGMDGANAMEAGFFTGTTLVNLDSEDEGQLFIGCAGGENTDAFFRYETGDFRHGWDRLDLRISGGVGGHSGDDINKGRLNAVRAPAQFLLAELEQNGLQLVILAGGGKHNAIAREARASIIVPDTAATKKRFAEFGEKTKAEYAATEPALCFTSRRSGFNEKPVRDEDAAALLHALVNCPHGVVKMSPDIDGLVQTSTNLAAVDMSRRGTVKVVTSQRSSVVPELDDIVAEVADAFRKEGAEVVSYSKYPGWNPDLNSHILEVTRNSYRRLFGEEPLVLAIHAGLECGLFLEKFPGLDMISFGPTLRGVHTPGEKLELASLDKFVKLLDDIVINFS